MKIHFLPGDGMKSSFSNQMWVECSDSLPKNRVWKKKIVTFKWKKMADTTITKWSRLTAPVITHVDTVYTLIR